MANSALRRLATSGIIGLVCGGVIVKQTVVLFFK